MVIDTDKLEAELKTALANCGLPTERFKVVTKHGSYRNDFDMKKFGLFKPSIPLKSK